MNAFMTYIKNNTPLRCIMHKMSRNTQYTIRHIEHKCLTEKNKTYLFQSYNQIKSGYTLQSQNQNTYEYCPHYKFAYLNDYFEVKNMFGIPSVRIVMYDFLFKQWKNTIDLHELLYYIKQPEKKINYTLYQTIYDLNPDFAWSIIHKNDIYNVGISIDQACIDIEQYITVAKHDKSTNSFYTAPRMVSMQFNDGEYKVPYDTLQIMCHYHPIT